jgi:hypothetical protein
MKSASEQEKDKVSVQQSIIELGYAELQAELESSQAAVLSLEGDRTQLRQIEARRQLEIINHLSMESDQHSQVMSCLNQYWILHPSRGFIRFLILLTRLQIPFPSAPSLVLRSTHHSSSLAMTFQSHNI